MRSVRFDAELDERVAQAARRRHLSVSEFIRAAVRQACDEVLEGQTPAEDWQALLAGSPYGDAWIRLLDGLVGSVQGDGLPPDEAQADWARVIREHNLQP